MKNSMYTYSLRQGLAKQLSNLAQRLSISPQTLIEGIVEEYLHGHTPSKKFTEQRAFTRVQVKVPALVYTQDESGSYGRYQAARLLNITPGGVAIACKEGKLCGRVASDYEGELPFELMFSISNDMYPIWFKCKSKRVQFKGPEVLIGAEIMESDKASKAQLQEIYEQSFCEEQICIIPTVNKHSQCTS